MQEPTAAWALVFSLLCVACCLLLRLKISEWTRTPSNRPPGSRYVSWLPSFSVEVTRVRAAPAAAAQLDAMARQVQQLFPHYPLRLVAADLAHTRSPDLTVDNILEGRLPPPRAPDPEPEPAAPAPAPETPAPPDTPASSSAETASSSVFPFNFDDLDLDDVERSEAGPAQFSVSAAERESQLQRRKLRLLAAARRRYLQRHALKRPLAPAAPASPASPAADLAPDGDQESPPRS